MISLIAKTILVLAVAAVAARAQENRQQAVKINNDGAAQYQLDKIDAAGALFEKAVALDPNLAVAQFNLGTVYHQQKQFEKAIAAFKKVTDIKPDYALGFNQLV